MCIYHAVPMTAAASIMERTLQTTTQDCIHTVWQGFDTFSSAACSLHALQLVIIKKEPFWTSPPAEVLDRTRRRVPRSISFRNRRPNAGFIWTWTPPLSSHPRESTQRRPTRCQHGGCEPSTPPVDPTTRSLCPKSHQIFAAPRQHQAT